MLSINHVLEHVEKPLLMLKDVINQLSVGDIVFIEVPLYTRDSFKTHKYNWSLWYNEHLALYSLKTLETLSNKLNMKILDKGYRNFISDNHNKKQILKQLIKSPANFLSGYISKKPYHLILDNILKDYGFIVLKK